MGHFSAMTADEVIATVASMPSADWLKIYALVNDGDAAPRSGRKTPAVILNAAMGGFAPMAE